jgi:hypothetical protein
MADQTAPEVGQETYFPLAGNARPYPDPDGVIIKGHVTHLRLLLTTWLSHFKSLGYIEESTMEMLDRTVCKKIVGLTVRDFKVR